MTISNLIKSFVKDIFVDKQGLISDDLKSNFEKYALDGTLSEEELALLFIALGNELNFLSLSKLGNELAAELNISHEIREEARQVPGINGMLNTYHKFRHFVDMNDHFGSTEYGAVALKMNILAKSKMGTNKFELLFIPISVINSCEKCVIAHEQNALNIGISRDKIHTAVKLAAILKGISYI